MIPILFDTDKLKKKLEALSIQEGHYGTLDISDVVTMIELRENRIAELLDRISEWEEEV